MRLRLLLAALALAAALALGWHYGAAHVQGRWDAAELQRERAAQTLRAQHTRHMAALADRFEASRAERRDRLREQTYGLRLDLRRPVACAPGASAPELGAVLVPAAAVDRLRSAGADPRPD